MAKAHSVQERLLAMEEGGIWDVLRSWVQVNHLAIGVVVGGVLLLAVGSFYWSHQKASGLESLRKGIVTLQGGDAQKALNELQEAGSSSLSNAERALWLFYLGEAYTMLGRKEDASKAYEGALAAIRTNKSESYLRQLLLIKVAQGAENTGADADARQKYSETFLRQFLSNYDEIAHDDVLLGSAVRQRLIQAEAIWNGIGGHAGAILGEPYRRIEPFVMDYLPA